LQLHDQLLAAVEGAATRRAFRQAEGLSITEAKIINGYTSSRLMVNCIAPQWLQIRLTACFVPVFTSVGLLGVLRPGALGQGSFGLLLVFCIWVLQSLEVGVERCTGMQQELAVAQRLHKHAVAPPQDCLEDSHEDTLALTSETQAIDVKQRRGMHVLITSLCVGYADHQVDVLRGICLQMDHSQKVGIYGARDSGKSLLLMSIIRLVSPRHGSVKLDGVDASIIDRRHLHSAVGLVPQNPVLLHGDVRFNLDPLNEHTTEKIASALKVVGLDSMAQELERYPGYDTGAGRGSCPGFALRERRLLTVARMVLRQPSLLLLDEALLGLDTREQALVQQTMHSSFADANVLAVAQAPESLMGFSHILELKQGVLIERQSARACK
jgi:ABC-type multidrug transport system fused ATPase/permease subunit